MALTSGLVSYWKFSEGSGTVVADSLRVNNGTIQSVAWAAGKIGHGMYAQYNNQYVTIPDDSSLQLTSLTMTGWAKVIDLNSTLFSKWSLGAGGYEMLLGGSGELYCRTSDNSSYVDSYSDLGVLTVDNQWHFFGISVTTGGVGKVYFDGIDVTLHPNTHTITTNNQNLIFGTTPDFGSEYMDGYIDEVGIWNRELTAGEMLQLYNGGSGLAYPFIAEVWSSVSVNSTAFQGRDVVDKGAIMDDLVYTMDSDIINMDDLKLQSIFGSPTAFESVGVDPTVWL